MTDPIRWAVEWRDSEDRRFLWEFGNPLLFLTRKAARAWIQENYGYIKDRPDLRHWRMPRAVKVRVQLLEVK